MAKHNKKGIIGGIINGVVTAAVAVSTVIPVAPVENTTIVTIPGEDRSSIWAGNFNENVTMDSDRVFLGNKTDINCVNDNESPMNYIHTDGWVGYASADDLIENGQWSKICEKNDRIDELNEHGVTLVMDQTHNGFLINTNHVVSLRDGK